MNSSVISLVIAKASSVADCRMIRQCEHPPQCRVPSLQYASLQRPVKCIGFVMKTIGTYSFFKICVVGFSIVVVGSKSREVKSTCKVADLHAECSSSKSILFQWETSWKGNCNFQNYTIHYFRPNVKGDHYKNIAIKEKKVLIDELDTNENYTFKFVHYMIIGEKKNEVKNGFRKIEASPHEVGGVRRLEVVNVQFTTAEVAWSMSPDERKCVSHFSLLLCHRGMLGSDECWTLLAHNTQERYVLQNLTACMLYSISVSAVDIDGKSSKAVSQTFVTKSEDWGMVRDLKIQSVASDALSVSWVGHSCGPYRVSIAKSHEGSEQEVFSDSTFHTSYTFIHLVPCTLYRIKVTSFSLGNDYYGSNFQFIRAYTSIVSSATVQGLTVAAVSESSVTVGWLPPNPPLECVTGYAVAVRLGREVIYENYTAATRLEVRDLKPCTTYTVTIFVIFSHQIYSLESKTISVRTSASATQMNLKVENISVINQTADSLQVTWDRPKISSDCLQGYNVFLYDTRFNKIYAQSNWPLEHSNFTFANLKQCESYYIYIGPDFGLNLTPRQEEFLHTFTIASDNVTVTNISLEANWNSLHLQWKPPAGYEACTRHYEVRVCASAECEGPVTLDTPSYRLDNLPACTSYTAEVRADHSHKVAAVTGSTRGLDAIKSSQVEVMNRTSETVMLRWSVPQDFRSCEGRFVISVWDVSGSHPEETVVDHLTREHIVQRLKPCHKYYFRLKLIDLDGSPTIDYGTGAVTTKASGDQKVDGLKAYPYQRGMTLEWSMDPDSTDCVSHFQVSLRGRNGSLDIYNTTSITFAWKGDPCHLEAALVQAVSDGKLVGIPASIHLKNELEDPSKLSVAIVSVESRYAEVQLVSSGFTCVSEYTISWYSATNNNTANTVANLTISDVKQSVRLGKLLPCTTYSVTVTPQNGPRKIVDLNTTLTTNYAEPVLVPEIKAISRGFNISWQLSRPDTVHCLSLVRVTVKQNNFHHQEKVFADYYRVIEDLIPCQNYLVTLDSYGPNRNFIRTFYSGSKRVTPEVLSVPSAVTLVNVTKASATLDWDVGASDSNLCQPRELKVDCRPGNVNHHSGGWQPARVWLTRLRPYTTYDCHLSVVNEAGRSKPVHVSFTTSEGVPSQPKNVKVTSVSSSEVSLTWDPPDNVPGKLTNYTVTAYNLTLSYPRPPGCPVPPLGPRGTTVGGEAVWGVVAGLPPAAGMWVTVSAATAAGSGPPSTPVTATTEDDVSDPVEGLNVTLDRIKVSLSWHPPCFSHGRLDHFLIQLSGTRPGHAPAGYSRNFTAGQILAESYSTSLNTSQLTAESLYTATVVPVGGSGLLGRPSSQSFSVPSRIPARASDAVFAQLPPVSTTATSATISIRSDLFPDTEGSIRYYAILVSGNFTYKPLSGWLFNNSWPKFKNWASAVQNRPVSTYQATPPWWNPFKDVDTSPFAIRQWTLGSEECSRSDFVAFCNGPLPPATHFAVRIRAFTSSGFRDSPSISFQTVDPIMGAYLIILALEVVAAVTTASFTYLLVKANIKWNKEKKSLSNPKVNAGEKRRPAICEPLSLPKFISHVENIVNSPCLLNQEYMQVQELTNSISGTTDVARLPQNRQAKNRYKDIIPYDSSLVKLEGDEASSYINASLIKFKGKNSRRYIACQGPKEETTEDFWNMILQYKVNTIVMLCKPYEEGKAKCYEYFPSEAGVKGLDFNRIRVFCTREESFASYKIRYLAVVKDGVTTYVQQFHFTEWPDKKAPEKPEVLVGLIQHVRKTTKQRDIPITVHCSAGVGRTGTFIVADELLRKVRECWGGRLSVADTVLQLRRQRHHKMVQTEDQYWYIYKCLKYALEHHTSPFERVRNAVIRRSKVDLGAEEIIVMHLSPNTTQVPDVLDACRTSNATCC